jgi:hypothetical protein
MVQEMVAAPLDHWIHNTHDNSFYKDTSNPFFGTFPGRYPEYACLPI